MNKSAREFGCCILANNTFNLYVKDRGSFLSSVQITYNQIAFVSHWDFWCPMYRELLHFITHLSCNFAVTSNNHKELGWIQFLGQFCILVVPVQCTVKFLSFVLFSSDIGIIFIPLAQKRFSRRHYILFHLANINIQQNNRYQSSYWVAINLFN